MRVFGRRNAKQLCRSRSNSSVAVIHIDNIVQPAVVKWLCTPCLLFVLFMNTKRWSKWLLNACPCFDKKDPISCFEAHWKFTRILLFRLGKPEKILPAWKIFAWAFLFLFTHFDHLSFVIIETCRNKTHEIFLVIMTELTQIYFFGHFKQKFSLWM